MNILLLAAKIGLMTVVLVFLFVGAIGNVTPVAGLILLFLLFIASACAGILIGSTHENT